MMVISRVTQLNVDMSNAAAMKKGCGEVGEDVG